MTSIQQESFATTDESQSLEKSKFYSDANSLNTTNNDNSALQDSQGHERENDSDNALTKSFEATEVSQLIKRKKEK